MSQPTKFEPIFRKSLIRHYYFAEAMAVYERYYEPLVSTYRPAQQELTDPGRHEDRPPTWVPLVFHCTTEKRIKQIFEEGKLRPGKKGTVAFTEIPIGELDRMKYRHHGVAQVAIGFPRRYIESLGLTPAWYLKHNPEVVEALTKWGAGNPDSFATLKPFVDEGEDVAPFQEIRTKAHVSMDEAVWLLTTRLDSRSLPAIPKIRTFREKCGAIPQSYWHRSHQMGILGEWQFTNLLKDERGLPTKFEFIGEHYWRQKITAKKELSVTLPVHQKTIAFETSDLVKHAVYTGPWRFIDVARSIAQVLVDVGEDLNVVLRYRLIHDLIA